MPLPYPVPLYVDGGYKVATPVSLPEFSAPIPNVNTKYLLTQKFQQSLNDYIPQELNSQHVDYDEFVLVEETPLTDLGGGMVEWSRRYAKVPLSYSDFEMFPFQFIGMAGGDFSTNVAVKPSRAPFSQRVKSRVQLDFFLTGTGADYATPGDIPKIFPFYFVSQVYASSAWWGGIYWQLTSLNDNSMPSFDQYLAMTEDARVNGWDSTVSVQNFTSESPGQLIINPTSGSPTPNSVFGGQICAEESQLERWMGLIYLRKTRYVLCQ